MNLSGIGYDSHRLVAGRPLILGGVELESELGLDGHSDADVLTHAVIDALLGAAGLGDIGQHFPDTDPRYKDADSMQLLAEVVQLLLDSGFKPVNIDTTVVAEAPKIGPYRERITSSLAVALKLDSNRVNIKATTGEGIGFVGRGEGIAAYAIAAVTSAS